VRVANTAALLAALSALPSGKLTSPDVPDLQPRFLGKAPAPDAEKFVIKSWQVGRGIRAKGGLKGGAGARPGMARARLGRRAAHAARARAAAPRSPSPAAAPAAARLTPLGAVDTC
jgi:hypothetical protein